MSDPDILLSIQAYTNLRIDTETQLHDRKEDPDMADEITALKLRINRLNELNDELQNEWAIRGNK